MVKNSFYYNSTTNNTFIYKSSVIWNSVKSIFNIDDPATSVSILKLKLKHTFSINNYLEMLKIVLKTILSNYKAWPNYILFINFNHKILYFASR